MHQKSVLIRGVAFGWRGLIRGVASLEGGNLVVLYYLCASEICTDKRGGLWLEGPYKRGGLWLEGPYKRGGLWLEGLIRQVLL